jgi:excinuclease ABC subunit A
VISRTRIEPGGLPGLFTPIRELYSLTPESKVRGYKPGRFSFNVRGGLRDVQGRRAIQIEMHFLPGVCVPCETCKGALQPGDARGAFQGQEHLRGPGHVRRGLSFFLKIEDPAEAADAHDVGLDTSSSASRRPRCRAARPSGQAREGAVEGRYRQTLYILDEPTTGLHFADIEKLLEVLQRLVDAGTPCS